MSDIIGPDHPLVKAGVIKLDRIQSDNNNNNTDNKKNSNTNSTNNSKDAIDNIDTKRQDDTLGYPSAWGIPSHPPTHEGRSDPETTAGSASEDVSDAGSMSFALDALNFKKPTSFAASAFASKSNQNKSNKTKIKSTKSKKSKKSKKKKDRTSPQTKRSFASVKSKWVAASNVVSTTSFMLTELERSKSAPEGIGTKGKSSKGTKKFKKKSKKKEKIGTSPVSSIKKFVVGELSDMAPCPSPSHIRGVPRKTGMIAPRTGKYAKRRSGTQMEHYSCRYSDFN